MTETLKVLEPSIPKAITLDWTTDTRAPSVLADPTQVHQLVSNLVSNAVHALRPDGGQILLSLAPFDATEADCRTHPGLRPGRFARLSVQDTGCGMDPETLARIFEPFFTTRPLGKGTGLGLAIVHGIVMAHGGRITVTSEPGAGTTLHVDFPEHTPQGSMLNVASEPPQATPSRPLRVLVVDDEEPVMRVATRMLAHGGFEATGVLSGAEALERVAGAPGSFDVAIVDLAMPGMSGLELSVKLLAIKPELWIFLASGNTTTLEPDDVQRAGIRGALAKPFRLKALLDTVAGVGVHRDAS